MQKKKRRKKNKTERRRTNIYATEREHFKRGEQRECPRQANERFIQVHADCCTFCEQGRFDTGILRHLCVLLLHYLGEHSTVPRMRLRVLRIWYLTGALMNGKPISFQFRRPHTRLRPLWPLARHGLRLQTSVVLISSRIHTIYCRSVYRTRMEDIGRALGGFCRWKSGRGGDMPLPGMMGKGDMSIWPFNFDDVYLRQSYKTLYYGDMGLLGIIQRGFSMK
ncbi:hypothetical protein HDV63DRAFT_70407, partial [Trichoderma sp. SZMC 28014]